MRLALCLPVLLLVLAACGGGGDNGGGNGSGEFALSPTSGAPDTGVSIGQGCDNPPLTTEWTDQAGGSVFSASTAEDSANGLTFVPNLAPGTYSVTVTCGNAFVGDGTFDVTG